MILLHPFELMYDFTQMPSPNTPPDTGSGVSKVLLVMPKSRKVSDEPDEKLAHTIGNLLMRESNVHCSSSILRNACTSVV